jgi:hypothetical protein
MHCCHILIYCASASEFWSFPINPPDLSGKYQQRHLVAKQGETWREKFFNFASELFLFIPGGFFNITMKSYDMGQTDLLLLRRKSCYGFLEPLKSPSSSSGFEPANLESNDKHTEDISFSKSSTFLRTRKYETTLAITCLSNTFFYFR